MEEQPQLPVGDRNYVACKQCHSILTEPQFLLEGCRKCGTTAESREDVSAYTTTDFQGCVGLVSSEHSWIARVIGCGHMPSGVYAAYMNAELDDEDDEDLMAEDMFEADDE